MTLVPILERDVRPAARRAKSHRRRAWSVLFAVGLMATVVLAWWLENGMAAPASGLPRLIGMAMTWVVAMQGFQVLATVPSLVALAIGVEKDKKTLDDLLTTRMTSAGIVLQSLASGMLRSALAGLGGLPFACLLLGMGGVPPASVALLYAAMASTAFCLGGMAALSAVEARASKAGVGAALGFAIGWLILPILLASLLPRFLPGLYPWAAPILGWLLASNPIVVGGGRVGLPIGGSHPVGLMIGLQCAAGAAMVGLAIARLRPAYRAQVGGGPGLRGVTRPYRPRRRPEVGDDPMLWKEKYTSRGGRADRVAGVILYAIAGGSLGGLLTFVARPAMGEVLASGYGGSGPDLYRILLNQVVRMMTLATAFLGLLLAAALPGEALAIERAKDTWISLVSTPLGGREILRAKMLGALWTLRPLAYLLGVLWAVGMAAGAVHPAGVALAAVDLGLAAWFSAAFGAYCSVLSNDRGTTTNASVLGSMAMTFSPALAYVPWGLASVFWGVASPPFAAALALFSHADLRDHALGQPTGFAGAFGVATGERLSAGLAVAAINAALCALAATALGRAAFGRFDRAVGRPRRASTGDGSEIYPR